MKQVTPGGDFDWTVVLRDACGYPFAVGTADGEVAIQVAATAPRGTVRLGPGDVARLALTLAEATTRAHETRPAAPPFPGRAVKMDTVSQPVGLVMFEGGQRFPLRATLAYDGKEPYEVRLLFPPGLEHLDMVLARELLAGGLIRAAGFGGMRVWLAGGDSRVVCIGWTGPVGEVRLEVPAVSVACFLDMSYCLVAEGGEPPRADIDDVIAAILNSGGAR